MSKVESGSFPIIISSKFTFKYEIYYIHKREYIIYIYTYKIERFIIKLTWVITQNKILLVQLKPSVYPSLIALLSPVKKYPLCLISNLPFSCFYPINMHPLKYIV